MENQNFTSNIDFLKTKYFKNGKWESGKFFADFKEIDIENQNEYLKTTLETLKIDLESKNKSLNKFIEKLNSELRKSNPYYYYLRKSISKENLLTYSKLSDLFKVNGHWSIERFRKYLNSFSKFEQETILYRIIDELKTGIAKKRNKELILFIQKLELERKKFKQIMTYTDTPKIIVKKIEPLIQNYLDMMYDSIIDINIEEIARFIFNNYSTGYKNYQTLKIKIDKIRKRYY
jgi:hypothetical protein